MKRRTVLLGGVGAVGALVIGWSALPPRQRLLPTQDRPAVADQSALNGWVRIGSDDSVTILMCKTEMGQGAHTGLAMLLAEELDADWSKVRVEAAPIDAIYNNLATTVDGLPFHPDDDGVLKNVAGWLTAKTMREVGVMVTGGSSSIKDLWQPMREAGASARAMLVGAAAAQWGVAPAECSVTSGTVAHPSGRSARYGELAVAAVGQPLPRRPALKDPARYTLIGQPLRRIEAPAKVDGSARFGIDVRPAGLRYASIVMCPTLGGRVARFDAGAAAAMPGVRKVLAIPPLHGAAGGVVVIADAPFQALRAVQAVQVDWDAGPGQAIDSDAILRELAASLDREPGHAFFEHGDADAALRSATRTLRAEYRAPYLAHAALEPLNCTVQFKAGRATVWASTQVPGVARDAVAAVLAIPAGQVDLHVQFVGGGFGRRLDVEVIAQAAAVAREADGAPVQLTWTREQDTTHDCYRPACVARCEAGLDAAGALVAWRSVSAGQAVVPQVLARNFGLPAGMAGLLPDKTTAEGAYDQPYEWAAARIAHHTVELPVPVGFWRSVGHSHQAFFKESFIDEVALAAGRDPVAFRAALLQRHPRHRHVLERAAALAGWGTPLAPAPDGSPKARGIALHASFGAVVAQVAEVSLGADKTIRVHRVVCVIDCG
ncbi:MAG: molybdopterin cofactor-binding domain-containing protein, partial [Burkholderiaceae bacterium]